MIKTQGTQERIRIVYQGQCNKLTARGVGLLSYELGSSETSGEAYIRISGNETSGTCSFEWIKFQTIEAVLNNRPETDKPFNAKELYKAFISKSVNNHGYLAAVLKKVGAISSSAEAPTLLSVVSFSSIKDRVSTLAEEGIDIPDQIAQKKAEKDRQREERSKLRKTIAAESKTTPVKADLVEENSEPSDKENGKGTKMKNVPTRKKNKTEG